MNRSLSLGAVGNATSLFLAISFAFCVAGDLLMPAHEMHTAWQRLQIHCGAAAKHRERYMSAMEVLCPPGTGGTRQMFALRC